MIVTVAGVPQLGPHLVQVRNDTLWYKENAITALYNSIKAPSSHIMILVVHHDVHTHTHIELAYTSGPVRGRPTVSTGYNTEVVHRSSAHHVWDYACCLLPGMEIYARGANPTICAFHVALTAS